MMRFAALVGLALIASAPSFAKEPKAVKLPLSPAIMNLSHYDLFKSNKLSDITSAMTKAGAMIVPVKVAANPKLTALSDAEMDSLKSSDVTAEHITFYSKGYVPAPAGGGVRLMLRETNLPKTNPKIKRPFLATNPVLVVSQYATKADLLIAHSLMLFESSRENKGIAVAADGSKRSYLDSLHDKQQDAYIALVHSYVKLLGEDANAHSNVFKSIANRFSPSKAVDAQKAAFIKDCLAFCEATEKLIVEGRGVQIDATMLAILMTDKKGLLEKKSDHEQLALTYMAFSKDALEKIDQLEAVLNNVALASGNDPEIVGKAAVLRDRVGIVESALKTYLPDFKDYFKKNIE